MDKFFQEMRQQKAEQELQAKEDADAYELVKQEYKEKRHGKDIASGVAESSNSQNLQQPERRCEIGDPKQGLQPIAPPKQKQTAAQPCASRIRLSQSEKSEIDALFAPYKKAENASKKVQ